MEKELIKNENKEVLTIDSREVAKMIKKDHSHLMRDINGYVKILNDNNLCILDYFIRTDYQLEESKRKYPCYLITFKGIKYIIDHVQKYTTDLYNLINYYNQHNKNKIEPILLCKRYETNFKELLSKVFKDIINFLPQYVCCNNKYRIDFYSSKYKLAVEYDEEQHKYQYIEDETREKEIHNELDCSFIRVKKGQELEGINKINKYIKSKF